MANRTYPLQPAEKEALAALPQPAPGTPAHTLFTLLVPPIDTDDRFVCDNFIASNIKMFFSHKQGGYRCRVSSTVVLLALLGDPITKRLADIALAKVEGLADAVRDRAVLVLAARGVFATTLYRYKNPAKQADTYMCSVARAYCSSAAVADMLREVFAAMPACHDLLRVNPEALNLDADARAAVAHLLSLAPAPVPRPTLPRCRDAAKTKRTAPRAPAKRAKPARASEERSFFHMIDAIPDATPEEEAAVSAWLAAQTAAFAATLLE